MGKPPMEASIDTCGRLGCHQLPNSGNKNKTNGAYQGWHDHPPTTPPTKTPPMPGIHCVMRGTRESQLPPMARMVHSWKRPDARNVPSTRPTSPTILRPGMLPTTRKAWRKSWCQHLAQNLWSDWPGGGRMAKDGNGEEHQKIIVS